MKLFGKRFPDMYESESLVDEIYGKQTEREISELESDAERLDAYERMKSRKRRKGFFRAACAVLLLSVLTVAVAYIGYRFLFVISEIEVVGDSPYGDDEICEGAGVGIGDRLFSFSSVKAEARLMNSLPYIGSLDVERHVPDRITFTVTSEMPVYYTEIYGKIYLLSDSLRLLGEAGDRDLTSLVWLRLSAVRFAEMGSVPILVSEEGGRRLCEITELVKGSALSDRITAIDLRSDYSLNMVCDGRYLLEFGEYSDTETKLRIADAVLKDDMFKTDNKARMDLSELSQTIVVVDNQLDLTA